LRSISSTSLGELPPAESEDVARLIARIVPEKVLEFFL
jgi:hypothetical protein